MGRTVRVLGVLAAGWVLAACSEPAAVFVIGSPVTGERLRCENSHVSDFAPDPGDFPAGVPYPAPAGGHVDPEIPVPIFPGAVEIDGFRVRRSSVQVFETSASKDEVLAFYDREMAQAGWALTGGGTSPAGVTCRFMLPRDQVYTPPKHWVEVSTAYLGREQPGPETPTPGFRGKGVPFAPPAPGTTWFSITTEW